MEHLIKCTVNGKNVEVRVKSQQLLLHMLRDEVGLMGAKYGCGLGECGACTVLLDGRPILSCLTLAVRAHGKKIETIEGVADSSLHPLQQAFIDEGAIQCGFCTSGMILTAKALLDENPSPDEQEIKEYLSGNFCRCTGYINIIKAIKSCVPKSDTNRDDLLKGD